MTDDPRHGDAVSGTTAGLVAGRLRAACGRGDALLVGAAIGTGMAAQAATRGGADFLLALNAGRLRTMGEPSVASLLALRDTNRFVLDFASAEIRPRTALPVFVGLAAFDPRLDAMAVLRRVRDAGFEGITNFPTVALLDGRFRRFLEASGYGFEREAALLEQARALGLATLGYAHTREEARRLAFARVDIVNIALGWNSGGTLGVATPMRIEDAADLTRRLVRTVRQHAPDALCVVEGGPIVRPEQADEVCRAAEAQGYVGGSTIDRVPLEEAIELVTAAFKTTRALRRRPVRVDPRREPLALAGTAPGVLRARAAFAQALATDLPVLILGEEGTGRRDLARALHAAGPSRTRKLAWVACAPEPERMAAELFGAEPGALPGVVRRRMGWLELARGATLVLDDFGRLDPASRQRLRAALQSGGFTRSGGVETLPLAARLVGIARPEPGSDGGWFDPLLPRSLGEIRIELPPLRDRPDDLPPIIQLVLDRLALGLGRPPSRVDPSAFRLLLEHDWPGNLRELTEVLQRGLLAAGEGAVAAEHLPALRDAEPARDGRGRFGSERDWILDALRRNRFRRGDTARFLGVSRKTLYNKMVAHGLALGTSGHGGAGWSAG